MAGKKDEFKQALSGVKVPVLTLDNHWYRLFRDLKQYPSIIEKEKEVNELLKLQGRVNTQIKEVKRLKKKLMDEVVHLADDVEQNKSGAEQKLDEQKRLIEDCNEKIEEYTRNAEEYPRMIEEKNKELMVETMLYCYDALHGNYKDIKELDKWLEEVKEELRKRLIQKQSLEIQNKQIYSYMTDIFEAETNRLFDIQE